ncbi:odorant receptor 242 [Tribolium castaneum]|uniref:Odorant receptor n=1 Tax=Tribolium castaneum TaxID=7070 RepID=D7EI04_TRICA|nr:odorant receptor 242 [Tribolium castaneum]
MGNFDDPFLVLRMLLFIDIINYKITKFCSVLLITFYTIEHCLEIYYIANNFNINLLIRYGPVTTFSLLLIVAAVFSGALGNEIFKIAAFHCKISWPLDMIRNGAQTKLKKKCQTINGCLLGIVLILVSGLSINLPYFGNQRELLICIQVFEEFFGEWSFIPYYFYFVGYPFLYYYFFRMCFGFFYIFQEAQLQFLLIEEYLLKTYQTDDLKHWQYLQDTQYQEEIGKSLRLCIAHHSNLKKLVKMGVNITVTAMPLFLLLGILLLISSFAFIINFAGTMTNILKIRVFLFFASTISITILFCWTGQQLINVTSNIYFTLGGAPWYYWSLENIKILLMFLINCTKNESIVLAGIRLDYQMFVTMCRISFSNALVLFNLRKRSLV